MKLILLLALMLLFVNRASAQTSLSVGPPVVGYFDQPSAILSEDERLGQPIWKATLMREGLPPVMGDVSFMDNSADENELEWSESLLELTGLLDALWTIEPGKSNWGELIVFSNGEKVQAVGSLEQGCYQLTYTRQGKNVSLTLERPSN